MKAFPTVSGQTGMDLRDYFAAQAIAALVQDGGHPNVWDLARDAYKVADAMLKAREGNE
jgi:hypothetical protein